MTQMIESIQKDIILRYGLLVPLAHWAKLKKHVTARKERHRRAWVGR